ncbi:GNAT family N-acetyltransferase [Microbacterium sp.]|uniref:GNAT family N-acetyltransferase n=1 Tax=Microbacterium sp. TaxID=51671 RepID=UPI0039E2B5EF
MTSSPSPASGLRAVPLTTSELDALAAGTASDEVRRRLGPYVGGEPLRWLWEIRAAQVRERPQDLPWIARPLHRDDATVAVGAAGFHTAPDDEGAVEISYEIDPAFRGRGLATAAAEMLVAEAIASPEVRTVVASVSPTNAASLRIVRRLGFVKVGEVEDPEDGIEEVFHLSASAPLPGGPGAVRGS